MWGKSAWVGGRKGAFPLLAGSVERRGLRCAGTGPRRTGGTAPLGFPFAHYFLARRAYRIFKFLASILRCVETRGGKQRTIARAFRLVTLVFLDSFVVGLLPQKRGKSRHDTTTHRLCFSWGGPAVASLGPLLLSLSGLGLGLGLEGPLDSLPTLFVCGSGRMRAASLSFSPLLSVLRIFLHRSAADFPPFSLSSCVTTLPLRFLYILCTRGDRK